MKAFMGSGVGRTVILELDRGDDIVESVEKALVEEGIKNAYIASAVGSIQHLEYHRPLTMDEATELGVWAVSQSQCGRSTSQSGY